MRKRPSEQTLKRLFALSGNSCAFSGCSEKIVNENGDIIGDICHIEAAQEGGERFNPTQNDEQRSSFENLILLCANHHRTTNNVDKYPVTVLQKMKSDHDAINKGKQYQISEKVLRGAVEIVNKGEINFNIENAHAVTVNQGVSLLSISGKPDVAQAKKWRRFLFIFFVSALLIFGYTKWPDLQKVLWWKDEVKILSFDSDSHITVVNNGYGKVFVSHVKVSGENSSQSFSNIVNLGITLEPGQTEQIDFSPLSPHDKKNFKLVWTPREEQWDMAVGQVFMNNPCYAYTIYMPSDPVFKNFENFYAEKIPDAFHFFDVKLTLIYNSLEKQKEIPSEYKAIATISFNSANPACIDFVQRFWGRK